MDCIVSIFNMSNQELKRTKELVKVHNEGWQKRIRETQNHGPVVPTPVPDRQKKFLRGDSQFLLVSAGG